MRRIDADELKNAIRSMSWKDDQKIAIAIGFVLMLVDDAPTVDPVKWVPVSERLPRLDRQVLTFATKYAMPIKVSEYYGYYGEDDGEWHERWLTRDGEITHWMPLPEPPKEATHEH